MNIQSGDQLGVRKPLRVRHEHAQSIRALPERVFPLLCPVRERDWVPGWAPDWVISASGVAEEGCIFQTPAEEGRAPAIWVVTEHDPGRFRVAMVKVVPGHTVTRLAIGLAQDGVAATAATIAYEFTALGPAGEAFVRSRNAAWYRGFMADWELAMNRYLAGS